MAETDLIAIQQRANGGFWGMAHRDIPALLALVSDLQGQIERLQARNLEHNKLSHEWMVKHDKLLGFIQDRPAMLAELIRETNI